jgi:adenylate cyclase
MTTVPSNGLLGYRLDDVTIDVARRQVQRNGTDLEFGKLTYELLLVLAEAAPGVVTHEELAERLWVGRLVTRNTMKQRIRLLRQALSDDADKPRYVSVVRGQGYHLIPPVEPVYDAWPQRDPDSSVELAHTPKRKRTRRLERTILVALLLALTLFAVDRFMPDPAADAGNSIAVLAFEDRSPEGDAEYLADGIAERLASELSKIPGLRVVGITSAFSFKGKDATIAEIAEQLNVAYVLEGSLNLAGDKLRISTQLIDARTDTSVFSENYDREMGDIFAIQDEIAASVVNRLSVTLIDSVRTVDETTHEVYRDYLNARLINRAQLVESLPLARELLEAAIEADPGYYPARHELTTTLYSLATYGALGRPEMQRLVRQTVREAAAIWPDRPEIAASRAWIAFAFDRDFESAARDYEHALSLDPGNLDILMSIQRFALVMNRYDDAIAIGEYILGRDPICRDCYGNLVRAYVVAGRFDEAVQTYETARALGFDHTGMRLNYLLAVGGLGDHAAVLRELESWVPEGAESHRLFSIAFSLWNLQRIPEFDATFAALRNRSDFATPLLVADIYSIIGDLDTAFEMYMSSLPKVIMMDINLFDGHRGDAMRKHPRWPELAEKFGLWPDPRDGIRFEFSLPE